MIRGYVVGRQEFVERLGRWPLFLREALRVAVGREVFRLQQRVMRDKLNMPLSETYSGDTGGQSLHVRTNVLRASIYGELDADSGSRVTGRVGTNVWYGLEWELRGFTRKIGAGARGGPKKLMGTATKLTFGQPTGNSALDRYINRHPPGTVTYPPRPFLSNTLAEDLPGIRQRIIDTVRRAALTAKESL